MSFKTFLKENCAVDLDSCFLFEQLLLDLDRCCSKNFEHTIEHDIDSAYGVCIH